MGFGKVDAFGQAFFFKSSAYGIIIGIDKVFETVSQPQYEQDGGIVAQGYAGSAFFKSSQSCSGDESTLSHKSCRNTSPLAGIADICAQFLECRSHWPRQWGCGFHERNMFHKSNKNERYVSYMLHIWKYQGSSEDKLTELVNPAYSRTKFHSTNDDAPQC